MRNQFMIFVTALLCFNGLFAQTGPVLSGTLKAGGVHSRNMELVDMVGFRPSLGGQFDVKSVSYLDGGSTKKKQLLVTSIRDGAEKLRIVDVTDPRNVNADYITITLRDQDDGDNEDGTMREFGFSVVYQDENTPSGGTFNGDVFIVVATEVEYGTELGDEARFVIINLSKAVALRQTGSTSLIEIYNASVRNVKYAGTKLSPANPDVYVGYVKADHTIKPPHTLGFDQKSGILALPTIAPSNIGGTDYALTDLFDLKQLVSACTMGSTALGALARLEMSGGGAIKAINIPRPSYGGNTPLLCPHDIVPEYLTSTSVRLYIGSTTTGDPADWAGGIGIVDVDYSTANACTISTPKYWPYDMDRVTPYKQLSDYSDWGYRQTHTASPFHHTNESDVFVVTADEFAGPRYNVTEQGSNPISASSCTWQGGVNWKFRAS